MGKKCILQVLLFLTMLFLLSGCLKESDSSQYKESLENGENPAEILRTAIEQCDLEMAEAAISYGADVNNFGSGIRAEVGRRSYSSDAPLRVALGHGSRASDIVELLIDKGADVDYMDDKEKETNLIYCVRNTKPSFVDLLLANGADVDAIDSNGKSAIFWATSGEYRDTSTREQLIRILLYYDAKVTTESVENVFREDICIDSSGIGCTQYRMACLLMNKADEQGNINKIKVDGKLKEAFTGANNMLISYMKDSNSFEEKNFHVVLACAASDNTEAVRVYLKNNDIDKTDRNGLTMLMVAAACGAENVVDLLIDKDADLQKLDSNGQSAAVKALQFHEYVVFRKIRSAMPRGEG